MHLNDAADYWGDNNLKRWPKTVISDLPLSAASKVFLMEVGLPTPGRWIGSFDLRWDDALSLDPTRPGRRLLCTNHGSRTIWIDLTRDGLVIWEGPEDECVVNSSVERFGMSLIEYDRFRAKTPPYENLSFPQALLRLQNNLTTIDPSAMASDVNYWPGNLADMRAIS